MVCEVRGVSTAQSEVEVGEERKEEEEGKVEEDEEDEYEEKEEEEDALHHFHASGSAGLQMRMQNSVSEMNECHSLTCWRLPLRARSASRSVSRRA